jgi:hypothetical protein
LGPLPFEAGSIALFALPMGQSYHTLVENFKENHKKKSHDRLLIVREITREN